MGNQFVERQLRIMLDKQLGGEVLGKRLADFARRSLADAIATGAGTENYETFVNGRRGAAEESVTLPGPIVYEFNWWNEILIYTMQFLRKRSPASSPDSPPGRLPYRDRFFVLADGVGVNPRQYKTIPNRSEILVSNSAPYHRKVDVQLMGREPIRINVPAGIMEDAALAVGTRFAGLIKVKRLYTMSFTGQYETLRGDRAGSYVHSPALQMKWIG
jgi:hypothetical protein